MTIEHGMRGDNLENELSKAEQELENNDNPEKVQEALETEIAQTEKLQGDIEEALEELGGEQGIVEVLSNMTEIERAELNQKILIQKNKINSKQRQLEFGASDNMIDEMWDISKALANPVEVHSDLVGEFPPVIREICTGMSFVLGTGLLSLSAIPKGIQTVIRKIDLRFKNRKLKRLEEQLD